MKKKNAASIDMTLNEIFNAVNKEVKSKSTKAIVVDSAIIAGTVATSGVVGYEIVKNDLPIQEKIAIGAATGLLATSLIVSKSMHIASTARNANAIETGIIAASQTANIMGMGDVNLTETMASVIESALREDVYASGNAEN